MFAPAEKEWVDCGLGSKCAMGAMETQPSVDCGLSERGAFSNYQKREGRLGGGDLFYLHFCIDVVALPSGSEDSLVRGGVLCSTSHYSPRTTQY